MRRQPPRPVERVERREGKGVRGRQPVRDGGDGGAEVAREGAGGGAELLVVAGAEAAAVDEDDEGAGAGGGGGGGGKRRRRLVYAGRVEVAVTHGDEDRVLGRGVRGRGPVGFFGGGSGDEHVD